MVKIRAGLLKQRGNCGDANVPKHKQTQTTLAEKCQVCSVSLINGVMHNLCYHSEFFMP